MWLQNTVPDTPPPITSIFNVPTFKNNFVNVSLLKSRLQQIKPNSDASDFEKLIGDEITRLNAFCVAKMLDINKSLAFVANKLLLRTGSSEESLLGKEIDEEAEQLVGLDCFVGLAYIQYDKKTGSDLSVWFQARLDNEPFCNMRFDGVLLNLSDVYHTFQHGMEQTGTWVPPDTFDRATRKFFVRPEHVIKVKSLIVKHLPTLVYGRSQGVSQKSSNWVSELDCSSSDSAPIVSVYFDNDNFQQYEGRLYGEEGATLIRIRWYGKYGKSVFVEQKTHHACWVQADSVKERFQLKSKYLKAYLEGTWKYEQMIPSLLKKGVPPKTISKNWALANEIQNTILTQKLVPKLCTHYSRTAFQLTTNNDVRVSLDTELKLTKELPGAGPGKWADVTDPKNTLIFPLAVLEIKLSDIESPPQWVLDLVKSGYLIRGEKFSKFQHGIGYHFGEHLKTMPYWFHTPIAKLSVSQGVWYNPSGVLLSKSSENESVNILVGSKSTETLIDLDVKRDTGLLSTNSSDKNSNSLFLEPTQFLLQQIPPIYPGITKQPKTYFASERTLLYWLNLIVWWWTTGALFLFDPDVNAHVVGYILISLGVVIIVYQMAMFWRRQYLIGTKGQDYTDAVGINFIVFIIMFGLCVAAYFAAKAEAPSRPSVLLGFI